MNRCFKYFILALCIGCDASSIESSADLGVINLDQFVDRPVLDGSIELECALDFVRIDDGASSFEIFRYEASGQTEQATCSTANRLPRHTLTHGEAAQACQAVGWRLCSLTEISRACSGTEGRRFPYGARLVEGRCNIKDAYVPEGEERATVAPSGYYSECVSQDGVYDLTGNLWEWVAKEGETYIYYGAGYQIIAERHRDDDHGCGSYLTLPEVVGQPYLKNTVGFRCCRDAER